MFPFKKNPAAIRKDGMTNILLIITFVPLFASLSFILPYFIFELGAGGFFYKIEKQALFFNKVYSDYVSGHNYFHSSYIMFINMFTLLKNYHVTYLITLYFLVAVFFFYFKLFFIDKFAPFLIHPSSIKKSFFSSKFQDLYYFYKDKYLKLFFYFYNIKKEIHKLSEGLDKGEYDNLSDLEEFKLYKDIAVKVIKEIFIILTKIVKIIVIPLLSVLLLFFAIVYIIPLINTLFWITFTGINFYEKYDPETYFMLVILLDIFVKYLIPFLLMYLFFSLYITWQIIKEDKTYRKLSSMGKPASRWGGVASYISHDFDDLVKKNKEDYDPNTTEKNPIYLGTTTFTSDPKIGGRHFGFDTDSHMLTIAQTGAGKSRDVLHTNFAFWKNGLFILDPKGEHAQRTYQVRQDAGFPVYLIDPYNLCPDLEKDSINLLEEIDPNSPSASDDILAITYACIPPDDKESGSSKHFRETAQTLFAGLIAHVLTRYPKEEQNLTTVFDIYLSGKPDGTLVNPEGFYKVLADMSKNPSCGKLPMQAVTMLLRAKEGERGSIFSTFMRSVSWTQSEAIKKVLRKSTFKLDEIRGNNATVYLVLPFSYMRPQARWIRAIIALCFKRAEFPLTATDRSKKALFVLDEFLQLENCKSVQDAFVTLRGAGIKLWLLSQSLAGIKEYYSNYTIPSPK